MVADPTTFKGAAVGRKHAAGCCATSASRTGAGALLQAAIRARARRAAERGFDLVAGLEVEFHLFRLDDPRLAPAGRARPAGRPRGRAADRGYQY